MNATHQHQHNNKSTNNKASMNIDQALDDLCCRFIVNLPEKELNNTDRILVHAEQAYWFYEDFYCTKKSDLPKLDQKTFSQMLLARIPIFEDLVETFPLVYSHFEKYKIQIPVYGAIILNGKLDKILMVQNFSMRLMWGFPKGKMDEGETEVECACREVAEETSLDIREYINADQYIMFSPGKGKKIKLFIVTDVPESIATAPLTRKEIHEVKWQSISYLKQCLENRKLELPHFNKIYPGLHKWIQEEIIRRENRPANQIQSISLPTDDSFITHHMPSTQGHAIIQAKEGQQEKSQSQAQSQTALQAQSQTALQAQSLTASQSTSQTASQSTSQSTSQSNTGGNPFDANMTFTFSNSAILSIFGQNTS